MMDFSLIIPTRNRAQSLKRLLDSLQVADCPAGVELEILVVNNGSTDTTAQMLEAEIRRSKKHSIGALEQALPGKANALNLGLESAHGDIMMILDDDVEVDPSCLVKHIEAHERTEFDAIQGRILPGKDPHGRPADRRRLFDYNILIVDYGAEFREIWGVNGTNVSFTREVFEAVGLFGPRLGPDLAVLNGKV